MVTGVQTCALPICRHALRHDFGRVGRRAEGLGFSVFDNAAYIGGICAEGAASYTRKQLDALTEYVKKPQIGAKGMVYARVEADGTVRSSVDKHHGYVVHDNDGFAHGLRLRCRG